ncbi:MAG: hypothetical protein KDD06_11830, partial [Phaeodactylibacter sp.]|nr:hypothetical protein [Phaeodactylibacter sp.]
MELKYNGTPTHLNWKGSPRAIAFDAAGIREKLARTGQPCFILQDFRGRIGVSNEGELTTDGKGLQLLAMASALPPGQLGDPTFREDYNLKYAYKTGAMANGIASEELVIAIGRAGLLGSFGAAGLVPARVLQAIEKIQGELPHQTYAFNLIHSPNEAALEAGAVKLFLEKGVHVVEASAFLALTEHIVHYRVA